MHTPKGYGKRRKAAAQIFWEQSHDENDHLSRTQLTSEVEIDFVLQIDQQFSVRPNEIRASWTARGRAALAAARVKLKETFSSTWEKMTQLKRTDDIWQCNRWTIEGPGWANCYQIMNNVLSIISANGNAIVGKNRRALLNDLLKLHRPLVCARRISD